MLNRSIASLTGSAQGLNASRSGLATEDKVGTLLDRCCDEIAATLFTKDESKLGMGTELLYGLSETVKQRLVRFERNALPLSFSSFSFFPRVSPAMRRCWR